jgi:adenosylhomocysteine nucleosidase
METLQTGVIFFAVPQEAGPLMRRNNLWRRADWALPGIGAKAYVNRQLSVVVTGMGPVSSASVAGWVLEHHRPEWVVTAGFAGGLASHFPRDSVAVDTDTQFPLTYKLEQTGARQCRFVCETRVAVTMKEKEILARRSGAEAVEMESGVIRAICWKSGIPSATVRVISDAHDENLPLDFNRLMTKDYRMNWGKLGLQLMRNPLAIPKLVQFQNRLSRSAEALAAVLGAMVENPRSGSGD